MKKLLKLVATLALLAAAAACVVAYWDKIVDFVEEVRDKLARKQAACKAEYDDYADWDE